MTCTPGQISHGSSDEEDEMGEACSTNGRENKCRQDFAAET
jgi:hypothetical protein